MVSLVFAYLMTGTFAVFGAASIWLSFTDKKEFRYFAFGMGLLLCGLLVAKIGGI